MTKATEINKGDKFGDWAVLSYDSATKPGKHWLCLCKCGTEKIIPAVTLRAKRSLSCTTCSYAKRLDPKREIGNTYGLWTVIRYVGMHRNLQQYEVRCECGFVKKHVASELRCGKSLGCIKCHNKNNAIINTTHNLHTSSTYKTWTAMKARCRNPQDKAYRWYGARGITFHPDWEKFENFLADMGLRPTGLTLDRINNNGNYEKSNCRWITHKENCNNRYY